MLTKGIEYVKAVSNSTLQRGECSITYGDYYMPSLADGTLVSSLTYAECEDIHRPIVAAILPNMGIIWNGARAVVFGASQYCGLGLDQVVAVQGHNRIKYLLGHILCIIITDKHIHNQFEYTQLEVDSATNPLVLNYD
jgi:hypothetical protein